MITDGRCLGALCGCRSGLTADPHRRDAASGSQKDAQPRRGVGPEKHERFDDENPFNRPLHAAIAAEFAAVNAQAQARTTVLDAGMSVIENSGWGTMQKSL